MGKKLIFLEDNNYEVIYNLATEYRDILAQAQKYYYNNDTIDEEKINKFNILLNRTLQEIKKRIDDIQNYPSNNKK